MRLRRVFPFAPARPTSNGFLTNIQRETFLGARIVAPPCFAVSQIVGTSDLVATDYAKSPEKEQRNSPLHLIQQCLERAEPNAWSAAAIAKHCRPILRKLDQEFSKGAGKSPKAWLIKECQKPAIRLLQAGRWLEQTAAFPAKKLPSFFSRECKKHSRRSRSQYMTLKMSSSGGKCRIKL